MDKTVIMSTTTENQDDPRQKILRSTSFSDNTIKKESKQTKMDALVELTNKIKQRPAHVDIPEPDYEAEYNNNGYLKRVDSISGDESYFTAANIKRIMPNEMKNINKDIKMKPKQDVLKRPEFLSKQHQLKTNALKKQEAKEQEESNELLSKLKSRTQKMEQSEQNVEEQKALPEFMKVKLKSKTPVAT